MGHRTWRTCLWWITTEQLTSTHLSVSNPGTASYSFFQVFKDLCGSGDIFLCALHKTSAPSSKLRMFNSIRTLNVGKVTICFRNSKTTLWCLLRKWNFRSVKVLANGMEYSFKSAEEISSKIRTTEPWTFSSDWALYIQTPGWVTSKKLL